MGIVEVLLLVLLFRPDWAALAVPLVYRYVSHSIIHLGNTRIFVVTVIQERNKPMRHGLSCRCRAFLKWGIVLVHKVRSRLDRAKWIVLADSGTGFWLNNHNSSIEEDIIVGLIR